MTVDAFRSQLGATITWCRPRFTIDRPKESLRSDELKPSELITAFDDLAPVHRAVSVVINRRASFIKQVTPDAGAINGRLLGFYVRQTLFEGVSEIETNGFLDDTNTPPWDSWVCMVDELLISWIPPAIVDNVQLAINCNAEECIRWLTDVLDNPFVAQLRCNQLLW